MRKLCFGGDPVLKTKCEPITTFDQSLAEIADDMRKVMLENNGVGLAAPQIGESKRIIIIKRQVKKGTLVLVNPEITYRSESTSKANEGCLSYPELIKEIERPTGVEVTAQDIKGEPIVMRFTGLEARIIFHEVDHLNGICQVSTGITRHEARKQLGRG